MADIVEKILQQEDIIRPITVDKPIQLEFDVGNLLANDKNPLDLQKLKNEPDEYLKSLARDNTQLLINEIWELPTERYQDAIVVKLPNPTTRLPREKPVPKPKPLTKWQEYAKQKGINKRKKEKLVWDETSKEWKPRWGYRSKDNTANDWLIEIPQNADPNTDFFNKNKVEKKERKAKNEYKRLKNIARTQKFKGGGILPNSNENKKELSKALAVAKVSTASVGKFTNVLPKEEEKSSIIKKRKFDPEYSDLKQEKMKVLSILDGIYKKQPKLDIQKGVNDYLHYQLKSGGKNEKAISKSGGNNEEADSKKKKSKTGLKKRSKDGSKRNRSKGRQHSKANKGKHKKK